jgi:hypothetical protein
MGTKGKGRHIADSDGHWQRFSRRMSLVSRILLECGGGFWKLAIIDLDTASVWAGAG